MFTGHPVIQKIHGRSAGRYAATSKGSRLCDSYFKQGRQLVEIDRFANVVIKARGCR